jgi:uncharacterized membrane protein
MAGENHIRNPLEWGWDQVKLANHAVGEAGRSLRRRDAYRYAPQPAIRRIEPADLKQVLALGLRDFGTYRTDVLFLCVIYPIVGLVLSRLAFGYSMLPMLFPLASGFALVGPIAAVGLYEMSRRREQGIYISWGDAFGVVSAPAFGAILVLGLVLLTIFLFWLLAAYAIYELTLGMIVVGMGVGFLFALLVLAISVVSFPLLLDRDVGLYTAVKASIDAVMENPVPMAMWGLIVAGGLVIGSIPAFLGLIIIMPVLGHATWHLYRKVVVPC